MVSRCACLNAVVFVNKAVYSMCTYPSTNTRSISIENSEFVTTEQLFHFETLA